MNRIAAVFVLAASCLASMTVLAAAESRYFLVQYRAGPGFNQEAGYLEQPGLREHHAYLRQLHVNDQLVMGGSVTGELLSVWMIKTATLEEAQALIYADPGVMSRILAVRVLDWDVSLSSMRFMPRKPMDQVTDPDSFRLRRIDSESAINLEKQ